MLNQTYFLILAVKQNSFLKYKEAFFVFIYTNYLKQK